MSEQIVRKMDCPSTGGWGWLWPCNGQTNGGGGDAATAGATTEYLEAAKTTEIKLKTGGMPTMQHPNYSNVPNFNDNNFHGNSASNEGAHFQIVRYEEIPSILPAAPPNSSKKRSIKAIKGSGDLERKTVKTAKEEELEKRREANRLREKKRRELMTPEERQKERLKNRLRARERRLGEKYELSSLSAEQFTWSMSIAEKERKKTQRERAVRCLGERRRRDKRSLEEREKAKERHRIQERERRRNMSELEREEMRMRNRERAKQRRAEMTPLEKEKWKEKRKKQERKRRAMAEEKSPSSLS